MFLSGLVTEYYRLGGLNNRNIPYSSGASKFKTKVSADPMAGEASKFVVCLLVSSLDRAERVIISLCLFLQWG